MIDNAALAGVERRRVRSSLTQVTIAALGERSLPAETAPGFQRYASADGGWSTSLQCVGGKTWRRCFSANVWKDFGRQGELKNAEAAGRWMRTADYGALRNVRRQHGRFEKNKARQMKRVRAPSLRST